MRETEPRSQFTALFERLAIDLLRERSVPGAISLLRITHVSRHLGTGARRDFLEILEDRSGSRSTTVTTNQLVPAQWHDHIGRAEPCPMPSATACPAPEYPPNRAKMPAER